jgi:hypothetical protein
MEIVQPKEYNRKSYQQTATIPDPKGKETNYAFQWLLFRPQAHAVEPFETNQATRNDNTHRVGHLKK